MDKVYLNKIKTAYPPIRGYKYNSLSSHFKFNLSDSWAINRGTGTNEIANGEDIRGLRPESGLGIAWLKPTSTPSPNYSDDQFLTKSVIESFNNHTAGINGYKLVDSASIDVSGSYSSNQLVKYSDISVTITPISQSWTLTITGLSTSYTSGYFFNGMNSTWPSGIGGLYMFQYTSGRYSTTHKGSLEVNKANSTTATRVTINAGSTVYVYNSGKQYEGSFVLQKSNQNISL